MPLQFDEIINSRSRLRELLPEFEGPFISKVADHVTEPARRFIAASPFIGIATIGSDGNIDVSPKGDPPGFVEVLDDHTLIIPDRPGNHRLDSFENLLFNPAIAIIFMIPGNTETLRIAGKARIVRDRALQERHAVNGKLPELALVVEVSEAFMHCSKAFVRSRMWKPDQWPDRRNVPSLAEWAADVSRPIDTISELQKIVDVDARDRLY
jgi:PPOX class probable FMN-dependent enzyme